MNVKTNNRTFVYGQFKWPGKGHGLPPVPGSEDIAIEILREYSATELVGKLYNRRALRDWVPVDPGTVSSYPWYQWFSKSRHPVKFEMEGSGTWEVLHFRTESDESGPYMAVALKYAPTKVSK